MRVNEKKRRRLFKLLTLVLSVLLVIAVALVHYFIPFRSMLSAYAFPVRKAGELRLHFLDVGQADCTIVEFPEGDIVLVDAGDGSWKNDNKLTRYLKGLKPQSLTLVCTHADGDHSGGFENVIDLFGAKEVYFPVLPSTASAYLRFEESVKRAGVAFDTMKRYDVVASASGAYLCCLSPYSMGETNENDASTVLYLYYGGVTALLCGDISSQREEKLLQEYQIDNTLFDKGEYAVRLDGVDILKVAHHGSNSSSSSEWLSLLNPQTAIISCGKGNSYFHPSGDVVTRLQTVGAQVRRTDELGDIIVNILDGEYAVTLRSTL